jgi:hypothetical protein
MLQGIELTVLLDAKVPRLFLVLRFEFRAYTFSRCTSTFSMSFFQDRISQRICPGWSYMAFIVLRYVISISNFLTVLMIFFS